MKKRAGLMVSLVFIFSAVLSQSFILSSFDESADDWSVNDGTLYHHLQNGNPDGFIEFEDNQDGAGIFMAPNKFMGDLTFYNQGFVEFDLKNTFDNGQRMLEGDGNVKISSSLLTAEHNVVPLFIINEWTSFSIPFDAESWGMTTSGWDSLISDVTMISIQMDAQWNYYDKTGLDNFTLKPNSNGINSEPGNSGVILYQISPKPLKDVTWIVTEIKDRLNISLSLVQLNGQELKTIFSGELNPGTYKFKLDCTSLRKGKYFIRLKSAKDALTKKLMVI
ncbi:MAG: T9SS type A sorting domain-containing protein [Lentimicrobium sp.]|nr:T9SS type A sorting domain-containing protein [Lentimicrobium sp.]